MECQTYFQILFTIALTCLHSAHELHQSVVHVIQQLFWSLSIAMVVRLSTEDSLQLLFKVTLPQRSLGESAKHS